MRISIYVIPVTLAGRTAGEPVRIKQRYVVIGLNHDDAVARLQSRLASTIGAIYDSAVTFEIGNPTEHGDVVDVTPEAS
jgi:hypothetical protein